MNIAILTVSSLSLVISTGTFFIMAKTAKELKKAKTQIEHDVLIAKNDIAHKVAIAKAAIEEMGM